MKRSPLAALFALTLAGAMGLAACGGGAQYQCADPLGCVKIDSNDPLHIAFWGVLSGPDGVVGEDSKRGIEIAIDDMGGKFEGHDIELTLEDAKCSPEGGASAAANLVKDKTLVGLIGSSCSDETAGGISLLAKAGLLTISPSNTRPSFTSANRSPDFTGYFRTIPSDAAQGKVVAEFAYERLKIRRAATLHDGSTYAQALQQVFVNEFTRLGGTVVAQEATAKDSADLPDVLNRVAAAQPEFLYYPVFVDVGGKLTEQARRTPGLETVYLAGSDGLFNPNFLKEARLSAGGVFISSPDFTAFSGDYAGFLKKYEAKYGGAPLSNFHAFAYDAANLLFAALKKTAVVLPNGYIYVPRQALRDALYSTKDFQGVTGVLSCSPYGDCAASVIAVYEVTNPSADSWNPTNPLNPNPRKIWPERQK